MNDGFAASENEPLFATSARSGGADESSRSPETVGARQAVSGAAGAPVRDRVGTRVKRRNAECQQRAPVLVGYDRSDEVQAGVEAEADLGRCVVFDEVAEQVAETA